MPPPRFTHNAFPTPRLDACVAFYRAFAGMRVVKRRGEPGERVYWLAPAAADLPVFVLVEKPSSGGPVADPDPLLRHLGFEVDTLDDLHDVHARLVAAGHDATAPQHIDDVVGTVTLTRDPDGRVVEFSHGQDVSPANWDPGAPPAAAT